MNVKHNICSFWVYTVFVAGSRLQGNNFQLYHRANIEEIGKCRYSDIEIDVSVSAYFIRLIMKGRLCTRYSCLSSATRLRY